MSDLSGRRLRISIIQVISLWHFCHPTVILSGMSNRLPTAAQRRRHALITAWRRMGLR